eukprot:3225015-Pyramimonas_sp.AAC.3
MTDSTYSKYTAQYGNNGLTDWRTLPWWSVAIYSHYGPIRCRQGGADSATAPEPRRGDAHPVAGGAGGGARRAEHAAAARQRLAGIFPEYSPNPGVSLVGPLGSPFARHRDCANVCVATTRTTWRRCRVDEQLPEMIRCPM